MKIIFSLKDKLRIAKAWHYAGIAFLCIMDCAMVYFVSYFIAKNHVPTSFVGVVVMTLFCFYLLFNFILRRQGFRLSLDKERNRIMRKNKEKL